MFVFSKVPLRLSLCKCRDFVHYDWSRVVSAPEERSILVSRPGS